MVLTNRISGKEKMDNSFQLTKTILFTKLIAKSFVSDILAFDGRGIYTAPCVMILMRANPLRGLLQDG